MPMTAVDAHAAPSKSLAEQPKSAQRRLRTLSSLFFPKWPAGLLLKPRPIREDTRADAAAAALLSPPRRQTGEQTAAGGSGFARLLPKAD